MQARERAPNGRICPRRARLLATSVAGILLVASGARAHIDLLSPPPRVTGLGNTYLDRAPCGQRDPGRLPERINVFRPGETLTVSWDAYVQHPSYFRLAFDLDGDDSFSERGSTPSDPARDDPTDLIPGEGELIFDYVVDHAGELAHVEQSIRLPNAPCSDCTLQLIQFIYDVPLDEATYYQCADITLEGEPVSQPVDNDEVGSANATESESAAPSGCTLGQTRASGPARAGELFGLGFGLAFFARRRRRVPLAPMEMA